MIREFAQTVKKAEIDKLLELNSHRSTTKKGKLIVTLKIIMSHIIQIVFGQIYLVLHVFNTKIEF